MNVNGIKRNVIYRFVYDATMMIIPMIVVPYVSRVLGADGIGIYSFSMSIITYFVMFAALGTVSYGTREIARNRDDKEIYSDIFWGIESVSLIATCIMALGGGITCLYYKEMQVYLLALSPVLVANIFDISWLFTGLEKIREMVFRSLFFKILSVACIFCFVKEKNDLLLYMVINSIAIFASHVSLWGYLPKLVNRPNIHKLNIKVHIKQTIVYFIPTIATSVYTVLDKTLIGIITGDSFQNGYYEQATKVMTIIKNLVFTSVNMVMGSRMSYIYSKEAFDEAREQVSKVMDFILLLGIGCTAGLVAVADRFVPLFFGEGYEQVIELLYLMSPLIIIISISNCLGSQYYTPIGKRAESSKYIIVGTLANLVMNLVLIPNYGAKGAVAGSIVAEMIITILYVIHCDKYITAKILIIKSYKKVISSFVMYIAVIALEKHTENGIMALIIEAMLGGIIYFVALALMKDETLKTFSECVVNKRIETNG